ncbi:S1C family serine protease [Natronobeatus ordinarius]|uniref:S1C family serine protease n=1 Tax=Natronobeatus ordinarius TaxID=2963433 RepID=UPI0020CE0FDC|nr:trypsin-like peptidase domain-containing protein [Natronobeatus ordinarius]
MPPGQPTRRRVLRAAGGTVATVAGARVGSATNESSDETRYTDVYEETIDGVVLVQVAGVDGQSPGGLGSGFVYDDEHLVTNDHVVGQEASVQVQFSDESWRSATVVGTDPYSDLAVLSVEALPDGAESIPISESDPVVGQEVVALGNPLGLDASVSRGIVSGVDRSLPSPTGFDIPAAIQTDAPVNPGNSGGPLVTLDGDVLGVVFAGAGQTIGFAIAAALLQRVVPALIDDGEYDHPYLGVGVAPVTPPVAAANDLEDTAGVLVLEVAPDSPAADAFEPPSETTVVDDTPVPVGGDVIVELAGEAIPNQERLSAVLALDVTPGETIEVDVVRDGERDTLEVTTAARPEP